MTGNFTEIELSKASNRFTQKNNEVRAYYLEKLETDHELSIRINELVEIVKDDHKDWSLTKIAQYICIMNQDLDGFSSRTIYNHMDKETKILYGQVTKPGGKPRKPKKQKSSLPSELLEEFRQQKGKAEEEEEETKLQNKVIEYEIEKNTEIFQSPVLEDSSRTSDSSSNADMSDAVDSVYDLEDEDQVDSIPEPHVIYDDAEKQIERYQKQIGELIKENEKLREDYERVIPPYEILETIEIDGKKRTQTIHSDPYKRTAWTEQHR